LLTYPLSPFLVVISDPGILQYLFRKSIDQLEAPLVRKLISFGLYVNHIISASIDAGEGLSAVIAALERGDILVVGGWELLVKPPYDLFPLLVFVVA
jgi:hypothetical protein